MESLSLQKGPQIYQEPHLMFPNLSRSHSHKTDTSTNLSFPSQPKYFVPTTFSRFRQTSNAPSTGNSDVLIPEEIGDSQNIPANGQETKKKYAIKNSFGLKNPKRKPLQRIDNIPFDDVSSPLLSKGTGVHKALLELQRLGSIEKKDGGSFEDWHTPEKDAQEIIEKHQNEKTSKLIDMKTDIVESEFSRLTTDFQILEILGKGSFGKVYRCINKIDNNEYAIKETFRNFTGKNKVYSLNETYALASLTAIEDNINVVRYFNSWIEDEKLYLVMEYCPSSLIKERKMKGRFTEAEVKHIMRDICLGLSYLHRHNMVHLDIKPENILISKTKKYKLGDMGQSRVAILHSEDIEEGDSRYLALELLNCEDEEDQIDLKKADIFSLGMTMFELITNHQVPPNGDEWHALRNGELQLLDRTPGFSQRLKNLVRRMLSKNPWERPSVQELLAKELPSEMELELKWERMENKMLQSKKLKLEEKWEQINKRRKSIS